MPARSASGGARLAATVLFALAAGCGGDGAGRAEGPPSPGGAVSAATPEATAAGIRVLARGGNAVDAAIAAALVLGVTEPSESGLGGRAVMLVVRPGEGGTVIHAPGGEPLTSAAGPPVAPPSALAVLGHAHERYGSGAVPWDELVEPAVEVAEAGWPLGRYRHRVTVQEYTRLLGDTVAVGLTMNPDRSLPTEGATVANPALATTLRAVADRGPGALTGGSLASTLASALEARGYAGAGAWLGRTPAVTETAALAGEYRGYRVLTTPEPYGGPVLLRALGFLGSAPPSALAEEGAARTAWLAEALGWARSGGDDANAWLAGLPPLPMPQADSAAQAGDGAGVPGGGPPPPARAPVGDHTTHVSVVDGQGTAVALTLSLGRTYGAGLVAGELGFFAGTAAARAASDSAGARSADPAEGWWAVPTVLVRDSVVHLVAGSPGGPRGVSALAQVVGAWGVGVPLAEAVDAPRLHVEPDSVQRQRLTLEGVVWMDSARSSSRVLAPFGDSLVRRLAAERAMAFGEHDTGPFFQDWDPWFGGVHAVARTAEGFAAAADPRRDGEGRVVTAEDVVEVTGEAPPEAEEEPVSPEGGEGGPPPDPEG